VAREGIRPGRAITIMSQGIDLTEGFRVTRSVNEVGVDAAGACGITVLEK
jgi:hypothetical protein